MASHLLHHPLTPIVTMGLVGVGIVATGGVASPFLHVLLAVVLLGAADGRRHRLVGALLATAAVRLGLGMLAGETVPALAEVALWSAVGGTVYGLVQRLDQTGSRLRLRDAELTVLYDRHRDPSVLLDTRGVVRSVNDAVLILTGLDTEDLVGRTLGHVVDPACHARDTAHVRRALAGEPQLYDTRIRADDGGYRDMRVALHPLLDRGRTIGLSVVGHDVSRELRARQALAMSERRYRTMAEHARVGLYYATLVDGPPRFAYVNPALAAMTGVPEEDWYADLHLARHHVPPEDQHRIGIDAGHRTGVLDEPVRYRWVRPDGEVRWHEAAEVRITDDEGVTVGIQGIIHDMTDDVEERDLLADALARKQQAVRDLERVDRMKNTFLQSVSHELRTPLTSIIGMSETLRARHDGLPSDVRATMDDAIHRNATKLQRLLTDLLDVDRLARGIVTPRLGETDLCTLATNVLEDIDLDGRRLVPDLESAPVVADAPKVERIVENLVVNAVRHTPVGATVRVATRRHGDTAVLVVEDDGDGVPDTIKDQLFEPFFQGPGSGERPSPGTGIGLALVARLTELHGGVTRVEDRPEGGARFVVELPCAAARTERPVGIPS